MKHTNPYVINDPNNIFELGENSSHPELKDARRIWRFHSYVFSSATELAKFFDDEGLNPKNYVIEPELKSDMGKNMITINVVPKHQSRNLNRIKRMTA
jgi:hypothetical protein